MIEETKQKRQLKTIATGGSLGLGGEVSTRLLTVIFQLILSRVLGPTGLGLLGIGLSILTLASTIALFGMHTGTMRFVSQYKARHDWVGVRETIRASTYIVIVFGFIITAILLVVSEPLVNDVYKKPELLPILRILLISTPFIALRQLFVAIIQAFKQIQYRFIVEQFLLPILKIGGVAVVIYVAVQKTIGVASIIFLAEGITVLILLFLVRRLSAFHTTTPNQSALVNRSRDLIVFSWPLLFTMFLNQTNNEAEILILGALLTSKEAGIYYVGLKVTAFIAVFLHGINAIFAPLIAELDANGERDQLIRHFQMVTRWAFTMSWPVFLILIVFSRQILGFFGPEFEAGMVVLRIVAVAQLTFVATGPSGWVLTMTGYPKLNLLNSILTLVITLILDFLLIPRYGILGAAIGGGSAIMLVNILRVLEVFVVLRGHPFTRNYLKPIAVGLVGTALVVALEPFFVAWSDLLQFVILSGILVLSYVLGLVALRLEPEELLVLDAVYRKLRTMRIIPGKTS